jgi:hypothetical protein
MIRGGPRGHTFGDMNPTDIVLIIAGVGYVLARRWAGQLLEAKRLLVIPVILTIVGITSLRHAHPMNATTIGFVAVGAALSIVLGLIRGATVHLAARDGVLWMRYRASTIALWVLNLALKLVLLPIEHGISPASNGAADNGILFAIGLGILAETLVVLYRGLSMDATVVWQKGKDGAPNRTHPRLEQARDVVRARRSGQRWSGMKRDW